MTNTPTYDNLPITRIMSMARESYDLYQEARKDFYSILKYLERTNRYKEDKRYKKSSFKTFISNEYGLDYARYQRTSIVMERFPDAVAEHGVGFVEKAYNKHGDINTPKVLETITRKQQSRKTPLRAEEKQKVVESYKPKQASPSPQPAKAEGNTKTNWVREHGKLYKQLEEERKARVEAEEQVVKLKETVFNLKEVVNQKNQIIKQLEDKLSGSQQKIIEMNAALSEQNDLFEKIDEVRKLTAGMHNHAPESAFVHA